MDFKDFLSKAKERYIKNLDNCYENIEFLYDEISVINDIIARYMRKKAGFTRTKEERRREVADLRYSIFDIYQNINYYKSCINVEKKEMKRIYDTYGNFDTIEDEYIYEDCKYLEELQEPPENYS